MVSKIKPKIAILILFLLTPGVVFAQNLDSNNYSILNATIDSGGGVSTGSGFDLLSSVGELGADPRLESDNYRIKDGFPNTFLANVPTVKCFETLTNSGTTTCTNFPNTNGAIGECGEPGCYDRAKIEINDSNNPIDALYLVSLSTDNFVNQIFFLQSDHSLDITFDIDSYMTQCELEGIDPQDSNCDDSGDGNFNEDLQKYNIFGLASNTSYQIRVRAVNGDFTETQFSPSISATTQNPTIGMDLDIAAIDTESASPYNLNLGQLTFNDVSTAPDFVWVDIATNSVTGVNLNINNSVDGLFNSSASFSVNSESEDLDIDDNDGGYGLKLISFSSSNLGPLLGSNQYSTSGGNEVGALSNTPTTILFSNNTGINLGQLVGGRAQIAVKARGFVDLPAGNYSDTLTFTAFSN